MNTFIPTEEHLNEVVDKAVAKAFKKYKSTHKENSFIPKQVFTNKEAMQFLGVSRSTIQRWRNDKKLPYSKVEGKIFYKREDLENLIETYKQ